MLRQAHVFGRLACCLTNQANRPRADGAPAPPASGPVEREVRRRAALRTIYSEHTKRIPFSTTVSGATDTHFTSTSESSCAVISEPSFRINLLALTPTTR